MSACADAKSPSEQASTVWLSRLMPTNYCGPSTPPWPTSPTQNQRPGPVRASVVQFADADFQVELVALRIGHQHPAGLRSRVAHHLGPEPDEPVDLLVLRPVGRHDVQVQPVLDRLAFRQGFMF